MEDMYVGNVDGPKGTDVHSTFVLRFTVYKFFTFFLKKNHHSALTTNLSCLVMSHYQRMNVRLRGVQKF